MSESDAVDQRRRLPSVGLLLELPAAQDALRETPRLALKEALQAELAAARSAGLTGYAMPEAEALVEAAILRCRAESSRISLRPAINATGVVLHTGLGRAVLCDTARQAISATAAGHCALEVDADTGRRGSRQDHVRSLLRDLSGAESAFVVNNNAGAVLLGVTALAAGREVILSRGELVEIGGAFRMPDIVRAGGATLVEVGTTNRTRLRDFADAINERTGLILRCHPSNYQIVGFTEEVPAADLARLGKERGIPVMDDLGSGAILNLTSLGAGPAVTFSAAIGAGCDVVTASGDKLLGGPQCGIIVGSTKYVQRFERHPLARALRIDKLSLAALEATLRLYRDPDAARAQIPTLVFLSRGEEELARMAVTLCEEIIARGTPCSVDTTPEQSQVGGGSLPGERLPTTCVRVRSPHGPDQIAARLRAHEPPIFARIKHDAVLLDPRTLMPPEFATIAEALQEGVLSD